MNVSRTTALEVRGSLGLGLVFCVLLTGLAAFLGAAASAEAPEFYRQLVKPGWAPPAGAFGPVWTGLYISMGLAAWLVWRSPDPRRHWCLSFYVGQLALNALWSWLFFHWHLGGWAFADILLLDALILATLLGFWRVRPIAGALMLPYLAWVSFAAGLNLAVWRMNPGLL